MENELFLLSVAFWGELLVHTAFHVSGEEAYQLAKVKIGKVLLKNHDIQKALAESAQVALRMIQDKYKAACSDRRLLKESKRVFDNLCDRCNAMFAQSGDYDQDLIVPLDVDHASLMTSTLLSLSDTIPPDIQKVIREHFSSAFVYAFKEIGLKRNEKVRAVITTQLLLGLGADLKRVVSSLEDINEVLDRQEDVLAFQRNFREYVGGRFDNLVAHIESVQGLQQQLLDRLAAGTAVQTSIGVLEISTLSGVKVAAINLTGREITIGRHPDNRILLPDPTISNRHAIVRFLNDRLLVRDLTSKNGTLLNGDPVCGEREFCFGDEITVGSYILEVSPPGLPTHEEVAATL